jgi:hypothetical protein
MGGTALKFFLFIVSVAIGVGVTLFYDSIIPGTDQLYLAGIAIVLTFAAFVSLYFMTKSKG